MGELNPSSPRWRFLLGHLCEYYVVYGCILVLDVDMHSPSVDNSRRTCGALYHMQCYVRLGSMSV